MMRLLRWRAAIFAVVLVVMAVLLGGGWYVSNEIRDRALKPKQDDPRPNVEVITLEEDQITLHVTPQTDRDDWTKGGIWGLRWEGGYAQVGEILHISDQQVVRKFRPLMGKPEPGDMVGLYLFAFPDDPQLAFGLPTQKMSFSSPLGAFPAWFMEGSRTTWVIFVHGKRDAPPRHSWRAIPILPTAAQLGLFSLIISYRNDVGAPASKDGLHRLGQTEWKDLEGAVKYAIDHGAEELILFGYSMGGAIITNFLYQSRLAENVRGVILDAPMLNFNASIDLRARQRGLGLFIAVGKIIAGLRFGIDWKALDYLSRADKLAVPILLFHGDADTVVPVETSDALWKARPDIVIYHRVPCATHIRSWNMNPPKYEAAVHDFLRDLTQQ
ncbi:lysophospholipase [Acidobacteria bacterium AH-259-O06]|nr:lysophospholipase [Acidobacteria bacterium AH-259-O06]